LKKLKYLVAIFVLLVVFVVSFVKLFPEFLWYESFSYESVWLFRIKSEFLTWAIFALISFVWLYVNAYLASRNSSIVSSNSNYSIQTPFPFLNKIIDSFRKNYEQQSRSDVSKNTFSWTVKLVILGLSVVFGLSAKNWWEDLFLYLNQQPYNLVDPIFSKDISFYFFSLPLFNNIQNWFVSLFVISLFVVGGIYFYKNILLVIFSKESQFSPIKKHLISLLSITFVLFGIGTWLSIYDLVLSSNGVVQGAAYTDVNVVLPVKKFLMGTFFVEAILILLLIFKPTFKLPYVGIVLILLLNFIGLNFFPNLVQNMIVTPNELVKEKPYIEHNIKFTQEAYGLGNLKVKNFAVNYDLSFDDIQSNPTIIENIRLWNQEPLKQTFSQLQEIRLYYEFNNVDVDRYMINGKPQQVMLSARELDITQLTSQAKTWLNQHLVYTHGYGLCMTPVNKITVDGLPEFFIKDLPPVSEHNLNVSRPEVYFGEKTNHYVIVNTKQQEFDYPKGDLNVYTSYKGNGGIRLNSFFTKLLFSIKFSDLKFILSSLITPESKLLYDRDINLIPKKIAPFLAYDQDPYLVLTDEGRMKWIYDAYTVSDNFPYSEFYNNINYIRNSVKVVIDAYDGKTDFYIMDNNDPIINAYSAVYDGLFKPLTEMPKDILAHIRYPKDLFTVQALKLNTYHMENPQVFYNREDLWDFPKETYEGSEKTMSPYYIVTKLPGDKKESFVLMLPFTPTNKNNMISWLAVSSDPANYGEFTVLKLPKERTIYGPMQIESRIDQDTEISKDLTLWGQVGSRVIRGNLMIIPIKESLLYVEPIYLQATQSKLPELKRVIVSYEDKVVMEENLMKGLLKIFNIDEDYIYNLSKSHELNLDGVQTNGAKSSNLVHVFTELKDALSKSKWTDFGVKMTELETIINQLKQKEN
jgi:uncharacterized protein